MNILIVAAAVAAGGYLLFRLLVRLGRPLFLRGAFREIDALYARLLRLAESDLEAAIERHEALAAGAAASPLTAEQQFGEVARARRARDHEREVNDKFLRLRIRFAHDLGKQAESAAAYRAYLRLRLLKEELSSAEAVLGAGAGLTPQERLARHEAQYEEARRIAVAVDESERRLDALLA